MRVPLANMDELQTVIARLRSEPPNAIRGIAEAAQIPYSTLRKIRDGTIRNPGFVNFDRLRSYYKQPASMA